MAMNTTTRIEEVRGSIYVKIDSDDHEKIEEAVKEVLGDPFYDSDESKKPKYVLRLFFDNHAEFYSYLGFNSGTEHGGTGKNFDSGGFKKFVKQFFESDTSRLRYLDKEEDADQLQLLCNAIAQKLGEVIQSYEGKNSDNVVAESNISLESGEAKELNDPSIIDEGVLVTGDSGFKIEVSEVDDVESLADIKDRVTEETKGVYENQVNARVGSLKKRVETLQDKLEKQRQEMMIKGIKLVDEMEGWKVEDGYIVYQETIHPTKVTKKYSDDDKIYKLTEEAREKYYIEDLKMRIEKKVTKLYFEDAYHPHALSTRTCSGSFREPLEQALEKAVEQMKHIDLHSGTHTSAECELKENFEEYTKCDGEHENLEVFTTQ